MAPVTTACPGTTAGTTYTLTADCVTTVPLEVPDGFTINGAGFKITARDPATGPFDGAVLTNASGAGSMHFVDLRIVGEFGGASGTLLTGIFFVEAGGTVDNVIVEGITRHIGAFNGLGIRANATVAARTVTITDTTVSGYQRGGLVASGALMTMNVTGSTIGPPDPLPPVTNGQNGVQFGGALGGAGGSVTDSTIHGSNFGSATSENTAVLLFTAANVTISDNTIVGNASDAGIVVTATSTGVVIANNDITRTPPVPGGPDFFGIGVDVNANSSTTTLTCNTFSGWLDNLAGVATQAPCITTTTLPGGTVGTPYSTPVQATIASPPGTWSVLAGLLPPGLNLAAPDGTIAGTPTSVGTFSFTVQVADAAAVLANRQFTITIAAAPTVPGLPTNVTATPGDGQVALSWTAPPDGGSPITGYVIGGGGTCTPTPATATSCVVTGLTNGVAVNFTVAAVNGVGTGPAATSPTVTPFATPIPAPPAAVDVVSLTPARLLDSRGPNSTVDGLGSGGGPMVAGSVTEVQVAGRGGVPSDAVAAVLNVTAVGPAADGFATVFPCGQSVPTASNLNYRLGVDIANAVIVQLDASGKACIYTFAVTHLLADVNGYIPTGSAFSTLTPARLLDSRGPNSRLMGWAVVVVRWSAGSVTEVQVAGRGGVPVGAAAAVLNVTAVGPAADGFATVFPCGQSVPTASNVNYRLGVDIANAVIVQLDASGKACIYTFAVTHLLADVNGYVPAGAAFSTLTPARLLDSRGPNSTVDGLGSGGGPMAAGSVTEVQVAGRGGVPSDAVAAVLNVTVVGPAADGFATVFPCGQSVPTASNSNYRAGVDIANAVIVQLGPGGKACIYTFAATHLLADVNGYIPA